MRPFLIKPSFDEEGSEILATGHFPLIAGGYDRDATRVLDEVLIVGQSHEDERARKGHGISEAVPHS